jgi:hypothetical protein
VPGAMRPQYTYDGWSGVPRLENNEPPLLQLYSNPKKAKLTVEVGACLDIDSEPAREPLLCWFLSTHS